MHKAVAQRYLLLESDTESVCHAYHSLGRSYRHIHTVGDSWNLWRECIPETELSRPLALVPQQNDPRSELFGCGFPIVATEGCRGSCANRKDVGDFQ